MNKFKKRIQKLEKLPFGLKNSLTNFVIGKTVKMVGACGLKFEKLDFNEVIVTLKNKSKVQNHIGQIHAAATTLLAETATGIVVGLSIPDDKIPLMKSLSVKFIKRSEGSQKAIAILSQEQINLIESQEKGEVQVPVQVIDETGKEIIVAEMIWAWIPKKRI